MKVCSGERNAVCLVRTAQRGYLLILLPLGCDMYVRPGWTGSMLPCAALLLHFLLLQGDLAATLAANPSPA